MCFDVVTAIQGIADFHRLSAVVSRHAMDRGKPLLGASIRVYFLKPQKAWATPPAMLKSYWEIV
jgi:hypothetical protein